MEFSNYYSYKQKKNSGMLLPKSLLTNNKFLISQHTPYDPTYKKMSMYYPQILDQSIKLNSNKLQNQEHTGSIKVDASQQQNSEQKQAIFQNIGEKVITFTKSIWKKFQYKNIIDAFLKWKAGQPISEIIDLTKLPVDQKADDEKQDEQTKIQLINNSSLNQNPNPITFNSNQKEHNIFKNQEKTNLLNSNNSSTNSSMSYSEEKIINQKRPQQKDLKNMHPITKRIQINSTKYSFVIPENELDTINSEDEEYSQCEKQETYPKIVSEENKSSNKTKISNKQINNLYFSSQNDFQESDGESKSQKRPKKRYQKQLFKQSLQQSDFNTIQESQKDNFQTDNTTSQQIKQNCHDFDYQEDNGYDDQEYKQITKNISKNNSYNNSHNNSNSEHIYKNRLNKNQIEQRKRKQENSSNLIQYSSNGQQNVKFTQKSPIQMDELNLKKNLSKPFNRKQNLTKSPKKMFRSINKEKTNEQTQNSIIFEEQDLKNQIKISVQIQQEVISIVNNTQPPIQYEQQQQLGEAQKPLEIPQIIINQSASNDAENNKNTISEDKIINLPNKDIQEFQAVLHEQQQQEKEKLKNQLIQNNSIDNSKVETIFQKQLEDEINAFKDKNQDTFKNFNQQTIQQDQQSQNQQKESELFKNQNNFQIETNDAKQQKQENVLQKNNSQIGPVDDQKQLGLQKTSESQQIINPFVITNNPFATNYSDNNNKNNNNLSSVLCLDKLIEESSNTNQKIDFIPQSIASNNNNNIFFQQSNQNNNLNIFNTQIPNNNIINNDINTNSQFMPNYQHNGMSNSIQNNNYNNYQMQFNNHNNGQPTQNNNNMNNFIFQENQNKIVNNNNNAFQQQQQYYSSPSSNSPFNNKDSLFGSMFQTGGSNQQNNFSSPQQQITNNNYNSQQIGLFQNKGSNNNSNMNTLSSSTQDNQFKSNPFNNLLQPSQQNNVQNPFIMESPNKQQDFSGLLSISNSPSTNKNNDHQYTSPIKPIYTQKYKNQINGSTGKQRINM